MVLPAHATNKVKNDFLIDHTYNLEAWLTNEQAIYAIVSYLPVSYLLSILMSSKLNSFAHWKLFGNLFGIPGAFHFYFSGTRNVLGDNPTGGCLFLKSCHLDTVQGSSLSIIWNPILEKDNRSLKKVGFWTTTTWESIADPSQVVQCACRTIDNTCFERYSHAHLSVSGITLV